jgi:prephenate dehydrogenase
MARIAFQRVAILGTGLIGASLGMALKRLTPPPQVIGFDLSSDARRAASGRKAVDRATGNLVEAVRDADLVVVSTPVRAMELLFQEIALLLRPGTVVTDTGSTKRQILAWAAQHLPDTVSFVGGHPMTGRATAGAYEATADLFENAVYCIAPPASADSKAVEKIVKLVEAIGSVAYFVEPGEHDGLVAGVSHLPYVLSAALMRSVATDRGWREARTIAAGGFATATHLADGDPRMFADICLTNQDQIIRQIDRITDELAGLRAALERSEETIFERFDEAQRLHLEWLAGRGADEGPSFSTEELKPQSLFFPGKLGDVLRRGGDKDRR